MNCETYILCRILGWGPNVTEMFSKVSKQLVDHAIWSGDNNHYNMACPTSDPTACCQVVGYEYFMSILIDLVPFKEISLNWLKHIHFMTHQKVDYTRQNITMLFPG